MPDLLTEEDFLAPKPEAIPWGYLTVFCVIAIAQMLAMISVNRYFAEFVNGAFLFLGSVGLPPITVFVMFFGRKKNRLLSKKNLAAFILILLSTYFIPFIAIEFSGGKAQSSILFVTLSVFAVYFIICYLILLPIVTEKPKQMIKR